MSIYYLQNKILLKHNFVILSCAQLQQVRVFFTHLKFVKYSLRKSTNKLQLIQVINKVLLECNNLVDLLLMIKLSTFYRTSCYFEEYAVLNAYYLVFKSFSSVLWKFNNVIQIVIQFFFFFNFPIQVGSLNILIHLFQRSSFCVTLYIHCNTSNINCHEINKLN